MSTPYQTCGPDCPYWQPTGVSRCEGVCNLTGDVRMDGNDCNARGYGEYQPDDQIADDNETRGRGDRRDGDHR